MNVFEAKKNSRRHEQDEYPVTEARRASELWLAFRSRGSLRRDPNRGLESETSSRFVIAMKSECIIRESLRRTIRKSKLRILYV